MTGTHTPGSDFPLIRVVLILWLGMYLWMMSTADWPWKAERAPGAVQGVLGFGSVPDTTLTRFGSAVPTRIHDGEWHRLFTASALQDSVLGLLLLGWWWASMARGMRGLVGLGAVVLVMIVGGAAGNAMHAHQFPDSPFRGPGPFAWVAALVGLQLGLGLFGGIPNGRRLVTSSLFSVLLIGVIMWLSGGGRALDDAWQRPRLQLEGLGTSLGVGALLPLVLGARKFARRANPLVKPLAWLALLAWIGALAIQMPRTVKAGQAGEAGAFLSALQDAEVDARGIFDDGRDARSFKRTQLHEALNALAKHPFVARLEDDTTLMAYLDAMRRIASGDMRDPHGVLVGCRRGLRAWHDTVEQALRRDYGLPPRAPHRLRRWDEL